MKDGVTIGTTKTGLAWATVNGVTIKARKDGGVQIDVADGNAQLDTLYRGNSKKGSWFRIILKRPA